jgi:hypothetical protein
MQSNLRAIAGWTLSLRWDTQAPRADGRGGPHAPERHHSVRSGERRAPLPVIPVQTQSEALAANRKYWPISAQGPRGGMSAAGERRRRFPQLRGTPARPLLQQAKRDDGPGAAPVGDYDSVEALRDRAL